MTRRLEQVPAADADFTAIPEAAPAIVSAIKADSAIFLPGQLT